jgi:phosphoglycerate dehydrogenase-like enzyme
MASLLGQPLFDQSFEYGAPQGFLMAKPRAKLLIAQSTYRPEEFDALKRYADIYWLDDMDEQEEDRVLPMIDCIYSHGWPKTLDAGKASKMRSLRLFQAGNAGVNNIRFELLGEHVIVCSNAGSYSDEVAEFAIGLMLASGKSIVKLDQQLKAGIYTRQKLDELGRQVTFFKGKTLGIVGYGGIGRSTARLAKSFGMNVMALGRHRIRDKKVRLLRGRSGLMRLLSESDVVVVAVPLTKATKGLIGSEELKAMRRDAMIVNVGRGEIVRKEDIYRHLVKNPGFRYATDVWWPDAEGLESLNPDLPFLELENFVGTPHASGPSAIISGNVVKGVVENLTRYFKGQSLKNVVNRSDYV